MSAPEVDVEDFVIAYLTGSDIVPAAQISARMLDQPPLPFVLVQRVTGDDDFIVDHPTFDVESFDATQTGASDIARSVHHAMRQLHPKTLVTLPDDTQVSPYGLCKTEQTPIYVPWEPSGGGAVMERYVARYRLNLRLPSIQGL